MGESCQLDLERSAFDYEIDELAKTDLGIS